MTRPQSQKVKAKAHMAKVHEKNITYFFRAQKAMVLHQLTRRSLSAPMNKTRELMPPEATWSMTLDEWDRIWQSIANQTTPELSKIIASAEADGLHAGAIFGQDSIGSFAKGTGRTFSLANPRAVAWFQQNGGSVDYIKGIQRTTGDQIKTIITNALDTGQSYQKTAKQIADTFDGMSRDRAQRIAVYETGNAYEEGNRQFADSLKDDGVEMEEKWMTSEDEKVRPEHAANEAEGWVEMGHVFSSGDTAPPTDPGCRCYMIYREKPAGGEE